MSRRAAPADLHGRLVQVSAGISMLAGQLGDPAKLADAVHDMRTGCKRYLAILRLAVNAVPAARFTTLKKLAKSVKDGVAESRDSHVMAEKLDRFAPGERLGAHAPEPPVPDVSRVAALAARLETLTRSAPIRALETAEILDGVGESYRRAFFAARRCRKSPTDHGLHEWRKVVKMLAYQLALFPRLRPASDLEKKCRRLGRLLGEHHDCAVLLNLLRGSSPPPESTISKIHRHQCKVEKRCLEAGEKVFKRTPEEFLAGLREAAAGEFPHRDSPR